MFDTDVSSRFTRALSALLFLYRDVLGMPVGWLAGLVWAKRPLRMPVVLTKEEVRRVLARLKGRGVVALVAGLLYGTGMRLLEALQLRVKDIDLRRTRSQCGAGRAIAIG